MINDTRLLLFACVCVCVSFVGSHFTGWRRGDGHFAVPLCRRLDRRHVKVVVNVFVRVRRAFQFIHLQHVVVENHRPPRHPPLPPPRTEGVAVHHHGAHDGQDDQHCGCDDANLRRPKRRVTVMNGAVTLVVRVVVGHGAGGGQSAIHHHRRPLQHEACNDGGPKRIGNGAVRRVVTRLVDRRPHMGSVPQTKRYPKPALTVWVLVTRHIQLGRGRSKLFNCHVSLWRQSAAVLRRHGRRFSQHAFVPPSCVVETVVVPVRRNPVVRNGGVEYAVEPEPPRHGSKVGCSQGRVVLEKSARVGARHGDKATKEITQLGR
eukprot:m.130097 g.130097  ORF g.130097 m.130097 type:complete len:318 (+) comp11278_c3_seq2:2812-3765(+)